MKQRITSMKKVFFASKRNDELLRLCEWKKVLHLWATASPITKKAFKQWRLLFILIEDVAAEQLWVDIDEEWVDFLKKQWYHNLIKKDLNTLSELSFEPDVILFTDTLEHLMNTEIVLSSLKHVMQKETKLIVTVPNALCIKNIVWSVWKQLNEHYDHKLSFNYQTLSQLLEYNWFSFVTRGFADYQYSTNTIPFFRKILSLLYRIIISSNTSFARTLFFVVKKK